MSLQLPSVSAVAQSLQNSTDAATISVVSNASREDVIASNALLNQKGVCIIVHNAEQYILRRTRNNKLILTK